MNACGERGTIRIIGDGDNATVVGILGAKMMKIVSILCQHGTAQLLGTGKHIRIVPTCSAIFLNCENVVSQGSQDDNHRPRKVFIRVEIRHAFSESRFSRRSREISVGLIAA